MTDDGFYRFEVLELVARRVRRLRRKTTETPLVFVSLVYEFERGKGTWTGAVWNATNGHSVILESRKRSVEFDDEDEAYAWLETKMLREVS